MYCTLEAYGTNAVTKLPMLRKLTYVSWSTFMNHLK